MPSRFTSYAAGVARSLRVLLSALAMSAVGDKAKPSLGGQAVIEGVMMRGPKHWVVSCRRSDGTIVSQERELSTVSSHSGLAKIPLVRGVIALYDAVSLALQAFSFSAQQAGDEEVKLTKRETGLTMFLGLTLALLLFIVAPALMTNFFSRYLPGRFLWNFVDGLFRITIFFGYIFAVSRVPDIARVFEYHGAEHKSIHAFEADQELTVANVEGHSTAHFRCGTSFLLMVMMIAIVFFSLLPPTSILVRILIRLAAIPVIAGLSYEVIKATSKHPGSLAVRVLMWPGMQLQRMTTREPDASQIEVAIDALGRLMRLEGLAPSEGVAES